MNLSHGMRSLLNPVDGVVERKVATSSTGVQGLAGWVLGMLSNWRESKTTPRRQLRLVETLALGGKRQLMLVTCAGESFLVGGGVESVETIVRLKAESSLEVLKSLDGTCQ